MRFGADVFRVWDYLEPCALLRSSAVRSLPSNKSLRCKRLIDGWSTRRLACVVLTCVREGKQALESRCSKACLYVLLICLAYMSCLYVLLICLASMKQALESRCCKACLPAWYSLVVTHVTWNRDVPRPACLRGTHKGQGLGSTTQATYKQDI
jgi:hypothetical protein